MLPRADRSLPQCTRNSLITRNIRAGKRLDRADVLHRARSHPGTDFLHRCNGDGGVGGVRKCAEVEDGRFGWVGGVDVRSVAEADVIMSW
jgi:hypothetical protein